MDFPILDLMDQQACHQKLLVLLLTATALVMLFVALIVSSFGVELAKDTTYIGPVLAYVYAIAVSTLLVLGFAWSVYRILTNEPLTWRETLPGAIFAALLLQASFQILPLFVRVTEGLVTLQAFGGLVLLLFWLYVMANILVLGAEINWWVARARRPADEPPVGLA